jgi:hypothetical protein
MPGSLEKNGFKVGVFLPGKYGGYCWNYLKRAVWNCHEYAGARAFFLSLFSMECFFAAAPLSPGRHGQSTGRVLDGISFDQTFCQQKYKWASTSGRAGAHFNQINIPQPVSRSQVPSFGRDS